MSQNHLEHFPQKGVQRLVSANPIPPIPLPCARRSSAPGHVQVHAPPQQGMFQKQFLAVSSPPSAVAATANQHPQPLQSSLLSVTRPAPGWGSRLTPCQSKPPNPETSLGSAQAHYCTLLLTCGPDLRTKPCGANFLRPNPIANLRQKTCRNAAGRARGHYGAGSAPGATYRPPQPIVGGHGEKCPKTNLEMSNE